MAKRLKSSTKSPKSKKSGKKARKTIVSGEMETSDELQVTSSNISHRESINRTKSIPKLIPWDRAFSKSSTPVNYHGPAAAPGPGPQYDPRYYHLTKQNQIPGVEGERSLGVWLCVICGGCLIG